MEIHKPRAAKTWLEFLIELGTIVAGILIALGLEQAAEALHHRAEAAEARETIRTEVTTDITRVNQRVHGQACVDRRLDELKAVLDHARPDGRIDRPNWIGMPSRYAMESNRWDAASHSGRLSLLSGDEQADLGFLNVILTYLYDMENGEQLVWARLRALEGTDRLSPDGLLTMRAALEEARFYNWSIRQIDPIILDRARKIGLTPNPRIDRAPSVCLPMTMTPEQARRASSLAALQS
jgi:hypothetical protein